MRIVLDTNVLISALLTPQGLAFQAVKLWQQNRYDLVTSTWQLNELQSVTKRDHIKRHLKQGAAGTLINALRDKAFVIDELPRVTDPLLRQHLIATGMFAILFALFWILSAVF